MDFMAMLGGLAKIDLGAIERQVTTATQDTREAMARVERLLERIATAVEQINEREKR